MRSPRSGRATGLLTVSLLANLALVGWLAWTASGAKLDGSVAPSLGPPPADPSEPIGALGRVEPAGRVVSLFGPPGDRLTGLTVAVGDAVKENQSLGTLSGEVERQGAVDALKEQIKEAEALKRSLEASRDAKLEDAAVEFETAAAKLEGDQAGLVAKGNVLLVQERRAVTERDRLRQAKAGGLPVSDQDLLTAESAAEQIAEERKAADVQRLQLANQRARAEAGLAAKKKLIAAEADRLLAQVPTDSLINSKVVAEKRAEDARLVARRPGRVVRVLARPGDTLGSTPVLQTADTSSLVVLAEVFEANVPKLRNWLAAGPVKAVIDGRVFDADKPLTGVVTAAGVAPMVARNQVFALGPREDSDRRVVEVEVKLDPPAAAKLADYLGLQVRVTLTK